MDRIICVALSCLLHCAALRAQVQAQEALDKMMSAAAADESFSGVIVVAEKGRVLYEKAIGYANLEARVPNTLDTRFNLCSITKQFTAMGIMMLEQQGKLRFDDPLAKYFPELNYPGVTIRNMLQHNSGLPDYMALVMQTWSDARRPVNADALVLLADHKPPAKFQPGERFEYCNTGYMLLACILEKVSGASYFSFLNEHIFRPLGMKNTVMYLPGIDKKISRLAEPYAFDPVSCAFVPTEQYPPYKRQLTTIDCFYGDGGLYSTAKDMMLWDAALKTEKLLPRSALEAAFQNGTLADGSPIRPGYGFGWFVVDDPQQGRLVQHTGGWPGSRQAVIRYLDKDRTLLVLRNNEATFSSIQKAVENVLDGRQWDMPKCALAFLLARAARDSSADLLKIWPDLKERAIANELEINDMGYKWMEAGRLKQALQLMQINVELYPQSANAYDSLGELYLKNGDREQSDRCYRRSKELAQPGH